MLAIYPLLKVECLQRKLKALRPGLIDKLEGKLATGGQIVLKDHIMFILIILLIECCAYPV